MENYKSIISLLFIYYIVQVYPFIGLILIPVLIAYYFQKNKDLQILFVLILIVGHVIWLIVFKVLQEVNSINENIITILQRFGLIGYLILFALFNLKSKPKFHFGFVGNLKRKIIMPFFFRGRKEESVLSFLITYLLIFFILILINLYFKVVTIDLLIFILFFSLVNAFLEELLWRKYILEQMTNFYSGQTLLITSSLLFGIYHMSLGFSLIVCLAYAVGGFYMGGVALFSKGILSPFLMHFIVNILFVLLGIIPFY